MRLSAVLIGLCILVTAGSLGGLAYLLLGVTLGQAGATAMSGLAVLTLANLFIGRGARRASFDGRVASLSRGTAELARQVGELGRRVVTNEAALAGLTERSRVAEPVAAEIETLGVLVKELAESVAAHEAALVHSRTHAVPAAPLVAASPPLVSAPAVVAPIIPPAATMHVAPAAAEPTPVAPRLALEVTSGRFAGMHHEAAAAIVRDALDQSRVDLYLQPILTLPQRKVRYYEAVSRLRTEAGDLLMPADFLTTAEAAGLMPMLDNLMVYRGIQIIRRLTAKSREVGLFCNIAAGTLLDPQFFPQLKEFLEANRALAAALVLEFAQDTLRMMGPLERENLAQLKALGFSFSLDHVTDLRLEPRALADDGFRFVKVGASLLLQSDAAPAGDIDPADFPRLLARYGIELIAEKIEAEGTVVDLLDLHVRFGQGFLFSPPRPVRAEVFGASPHSAPAVTVEPQAPRPRRREPEYPQAPAAPMRTPTGVAQIAREMVRRA